MIELVVWLLAQSIGVSIVICFFCDYLITEDGALSWYGNFLRDMPRGLDYYLGSPLGLCPYCFGFWVVQIYLFLVVGWTPTVFFIFTGVFYYIIDKTHGKFTFL